MRSPTRSISFGISWSRGITPSMRPDSTMTLPRSMRLTVPVSRLSSRSRKSLRICSRSASRIFCRITCFAACAPMRPNSTGSSGSSMTSPSFSVGPRSAGVGDRDLVRGLLVLLVGHDRPAAERFVVAGLAVDRHAHVDLVLEALLRRRRERRSRARGTRCPSARSSRARARRPAAAFPRFMSPSSTRSSAPAAPDRFPRAGSSAFPARSR